MSSNYPFSLWRGTHSPLEVYLFPFGGVPIPPLEVYPFPFGGVPIPPLEEYPFPLWRSTHSPLEEYPFPFGGVPIPPLEGGRGRFSYKILIKKAMYPKRCIAFLLKSLFFFVGKIFFYTFAP